MMMITTTTTMMMMMMMLNLLRAGEWHEHVLDQHGDANGDGCR